MNAWNVHDLIAFVRVAELFGCAVKRDRDRLEVRRSGTERGDFWVVFDRRNGGVVLYHAPNEPNGPVQHSKPGEVGSPAGWYTHLGITCDVSRTTKATAFG